MSSSRIFVLENDVDPCKVLIENWSWMLPCGHSGMRAMLKCCEESGLSLGRHSIANFLCLIKELAVLNNKAHKTCFAEYVMEVINDFQENVKTILSEIVSSTPSIQVESHVPDVVCINLTSDDEATPPQIENGADKSAPEDEAAPF